MTSYRHHPHTYALSAGQSRHRMVWDEAVWRAYCGQFRSPTSATVEPGSVRCIMCNMKADRMGA